MSVASPREMFIEALRYHAVHIILVHNHPSGDPSPSSEDKKLTAQVKEAGLFLVSGFWIILLSGNNSYFSFKDGELYSYENSKYILAGLSVFCVLLIAVITINSSFLTPAAYPVSDTSLYRSSRVEYRWYKPLQQYQGLFFPEGGAGGECKAHAAY